MSMQTAYAAVGRALLTAQLLEAALIPIFEMHRLTVEPDRLKETGGYLSAGAFKVPITNIVKMLADRGAIAPDLETRLRAYVDNRNLLVHRWVHERGIPDSEKDYLLLAIFALRFDVEARELIRIFAGYVVKYAEPEWAAANLDAYREKMAQMFLIAHKDS